MNHADARQCSMHPEYLPGVFLCLGIVMRIKVHFEHIPFPVAWEVGSFL